MFSKPISGASSVPHNKRVAIIISYIRMVTKKKLRQNIHQDAPNYTIFKKFSGEHAPKPLAKRMERHANL